MKKIILIVLLISSSVLPAQDFWTDISPFNPSDGVDLKHLSFSNGAVWAVGSDSFDIVSPIKWIRGDADGTNWVTGNISGSNGVTANSICGISSTTAYIAAHPIAIGFSGGVWVTNDSGQNWIKQTTALFNTSTSYPAFVHFYNAQNGVVVGDPADGFFEIYVTENGGEFWTRVPIENIPMSLENEFVTTTDFEASGNSLWFSTNKNRVFQSADMGATWTANSFLSLNPNIMSKCAFKDEMNGLLVTSDEYQFYRTSDGGANWSWYLPSSGMRNGRLWSVPGTDIHFLTGQDIDTGINGCSFSPDSGITWFDFNQLEDDPIIPIAMAAPDLELAFCVGSTASSVPSTNKRLYRHSSANLQLGKTTFDMNMNTVYPNPTKDFVYFTDCDFSSIQVFDALGQSLELGFFDGALDLTTCKDGVYFAKTISTSGKMKTIKIIKH